MVCRVALKALVSNNLRGGEMAKIRVFELAKDLNITNKVLLEKMQELNISVISHLSSLEDEDVVKIRENVLGGKRKKTEEARVKPTIIRRRRDVPPEPKPGPEESAVPVADADVTPESADVGLVEEPRDVGLSSEKESISVSKAPVSVLPDVETHHAPQEAVKKPHLAQKAASGSEIQQPVKRRRAEIPAKIIAPAVKPPVSAQEEVPAAEAPDAAAVVPSSPASLGKSEVQTAPEDLKPADISEISPATPESASATEPEMAPSEELPQPETAVEASPEIQAQSVADMRLEKSGKKKKKPKRDMPAKIISLPPADFELPVAATVHPAEARAAESGAHPSKWHKPKTDKVAPSPAAAVVPAVEKPKDAVVRDKKKKKGVKEVEEEVIELKPVKKKSAFRKKEIVEGVDLYSESPRMRKSGKKGGKGGKALPVLQKPLLTTPKAIKRRIKVDDTIAVSELAKRMGVKASEIIVKLMKMGVMATLNQIIDYDTAVLVATEFSFEVERAAFEEDTLMKIEDVDPEKRIGRPPVVTIMGHVDHGKTSLLDVIRKTHVTEGEAGGITQHIGAYHVTTDRGQIVFLDTPGHEAFTAMRSRGASITDLVILVVAADDGVMPQTLEAINHSRVANVPIIVAINKIDKPGADPERVQRELADAGLVSEEWGGDTIFVRVSAKANQGIDTLLEMILLQAEVMELKADPGRPAFGHVIEAKLDVGRGPVATVLVQQGTLRAGDAIVCGVHYGKVRALLDDRGVQVESAGPSMPVEVIGLSGVPMAGDELVVLADEKDAREVSSHRIQKQRSKDLGKTSRLSLDKLFEQMKDGLVRDLNVILKADVHGSIEALGDSLVKLSNEEVNINIVHSATGAITESDVSLATVSDAIIIGFNVRPSAKVQAMAAEEHVDMRFYNIIYNVIKDVKDAIVGMMKSTFEERVLGRAEVRDIFHVPKVGAIAGCYVTDGKIQRGKQIRLLRDGIVAFDGKLGSLRRYKDDVKEVVSGYECGIGIENFNDIKVGDIIECYYMEELKPEVE